MAGSATSRARRALARAKAIVTMRLYVSRRLKDRVFDQFHAIYYDLGRQTWKNTRWLGHPVNKLPLDLWLYQEMLHELRPDLVVETGTLYGGSAQFLGSVCDLLDHGEVISIDLAPRATPDHPRVTYLVGSSVADDVVAQVRERARGKERVMVILDSDHSRDHVLAELRAYADVVTPGSYVVVEDTNINGHPVEPDWGPGPMEAIDDFLAETDAFVIDEEREKFLLTFNPRGYLERVG